MTIASSLPLNMYSTTTSAFPLPDKIIMGSSLLFGRTQKVTLVQALAEIFDFVLQSNKPQRVPLSNIRFAVWLQYV